MAARDPAWDVFTRHLRAAMSRQGVSAGALARELDTSEETVKNWRKGTTRPRLDQLVPIARTLKIALPGSDPDGAYLLREMGILDEGVDSDQLMNAAFRLQKLERRLTSATERAASVGRATGAANIIQASLRVGGPYAVAV